MVRCESLGNLVTVTFIQWPLTKLREQFEDVAGDLDDYREPETRRP